MKCAACPTLISVATKIAASFQRDLCSRCYWSLPDPTRKAYQRREISTRDAVRCLTAHLSSVRKFGGGKRRSVR